MNTLSPKRRRFIKEMVKGKNQTQAAMIAYDAKNEKVASVLATRLMKSQLFVKQMERAGLTLNKMAGILSEGTFTPTKKFFYKGEVVDESPDWFARIAFLRLALHAHGIMEQAKENQEEEKEPLIVKAVVFQDNRVEISNPPILQTIEATEVLSIYVEENTEVTDKV